MKKGPEVDSAFRRLLVLEGFCPENEGHPHRWVDYEWLDDFRVWFRRCQLCGAIEFWRGNDTIYFGPTPELPDRKSLVTFYQRYELEAPKLLKHFLAEGWYWKSKEEQKKDH